MEEKEINKVEEVKKEEPQQYEYKADALKQIEENRQKFYKGYRLSSLFKWPVFILGIGLLAFACFGIPNMGITDERLRITLLVSICVVSALGMFAYTFISKAVLSKKAKKYFGKFYDQVTKYVFDSKDIKSVSCDASEKIDRIEFDENLLYKDIDMVGSRAMTYVTYKDQKVKVCDLAAQVRVDRRPRPVFVGKYMVANSNYEVNDPIFVYIKGDEKRSLPPTNMEGTNLVYDDNKMAVYSNNSQWGKYIVSKIKTAMLHLKEGDFLVDISFSFRPGKVLICMGYDDELMILPLEKPFNPKPTEEYKKEMQKVLKLVEELNK